MEREAAAFFVSLAMALVTAAWIFKPIVERTRQTSSHSLRVADLFALVVLWQYALALDLVLHWKDNSDPSHIVFAVLLAVVLTGLWYGLAGTLSARGVFAVVRRLICLGVGVPLGLASTLLIPPVSLMLYAAIFEPNSRDSDFEGVYAAGTLVFAIAMSRCILSWSSMPPRYEDCSCASGGGSALND